MAVIAATSTNLEPIYDGIRADWRRDIKEYWRGNTADDEIKQSAGAHRFTGSDMGAVASISSELHTDEPGKTAKPSRHTQAYLAALRRPYLQQIAERISQGARENNPKIVLSCIPLMENVWENTDIRDDAAAEYFTLIDSALKKALDYSPAQLRALHDVVTSVLEKRLEFGARRESRRLLMSVGAFPRPSLDLESALEAAYEEALDDEEEEAE